MWIHKTWGESDEPLLPKELLRPLEKLNQSFTFEHVDRKGRIRISSTNFASLTRIFEWRKYLSFDDLIDTLNDIAAVLQTEDFERWLDFPVLPKVSPGDRFAISALPLLRRTHLQLQTNDIDLLTLGQHLRDGSFLTIMNLTNDFVTALDLTITARNYFDAPETDSYPTTLDDVLTYLNHCILFEHGLSRTSKDVDRLHEIVGMRLGFHKDGIHTLQSISDCFGVTRERVRQLVEQWTDDAIHLERKWPAPLVVQSLVQCLLSQQSWDEEQLQAVLQSKFQTFWQQPRQLIAKMLFKFSFEQSSLQPNISILLTPDAESPKIHLPSKQDVRKSIVHCSGKSCFALIEDVAHDLSVRYMEPSLETLRAVIRDNAMHGNLPLGYVCDSGRKDQIMPVSRALLMLAWAGELSIDEIRIGLDRYARFRQMPPPPPAEVLEEFFRQRPEFSVNGYVVRPTIATNRNEDTVEGKIALLCEQHDGAVVSKALIHDHFRRQGIYNSSPSLYITYGSILRPAGVGCVTIVGRTPSAEQIEAARDLARHLTIESRITWSTEDGLQVAEIQIGTAFRDSGTLSLSAPKARWLSGYRFRVLSEELREHGTLSVSNNFLYGFTPFLNAQQIDAGDTIQVQFDISQEVARISINPPHSGF